jgi:hypothetical protein
MLQIPHNDLISPIVTYSEFIATSFDITLVDKQSHYRPGQAWTGPDGSRRLRLPDFKTVGT